MNKATKLKALQALAGKEPIEDSSDPLGELQAQGMQQALAELSQGYGQATDFLDEKLKEQKDPVMQSIAKLQKKFDPSLSDDESLARAEGDADLAEQSASMIGSVKRLPDLGDNVLALFGDKADEIAAAAKKADPKTARRIQLLNELQSGPREVGNDFMPIDDLRKVDRASLDRAKSKLLDNKRMSRTAKAPKYADDDDSYEALLEKIRARYGDSLPYSELEEAKKYGGDIFEYLKANPQGSPYVFGNISNPVWSPGREALEEAGKWNRPMPMPAKVDEKLLDGVLGRGVSQGTEEPFMWMDRKYKTTQNLLKDRKNPLEIHTGSDLVGMDEYRNLLRQGDTVNMHVATPDDQISRIIEPGSPSVKRRLEALKQLKSEGTKTRLIHDAFIPEEGVEALPDYLSSKTKGKEIWQLAKELGIPFEQNNVPVSKAVRSRMKRELGE